MTTVNVGKASVTDELSGGYSYEITIPKTARERNKALRESLKLVLEKENEIKKLREQLASANARAGNAVHEQARIDQLYEDAGR
jgi:hypothetical protein